jgi:ABC-type multidrug transport system ATPase subunit
VSELNIASVVAAGGATGAAASTTAMLTLEGVSKRFRGGNYGVRDVSLALSSGVIGLLGPNGAGKTTLMQMIATITRPTSGRILFEGVDIAKRPNELRRKLGYLPQDFGVYENLTALEFLTYFAALKGVHSKKRVLEMLESVNLHTVADRSLGGFSGGMRQRLGIAQALVNDPALVIVDEPTAGLDPEERVRFRNVLSEIGFGKLVILSTHIVSDIESIATQIAVMKEGRLLTMATPEALLREAQGNVWKTVVSSEQFDQLRTTLKISSAIRKSDGVHIRFVGPEHAISAQAVEPELEDAFLYLMNFAGSPGST